MEDDDDQHRETGHFFASWEIPGRGDTVPRTGWAEAGSITIRQASQFHRWCHHPLVELYWFATRVCSRQMAIARRPYDVGSAAAGCDVSNRGAAAVESIVPADLTDAQRARGPGVRFAPSVAGRPRLDPVYGSMPAL